MNRHAKRRHQVEHDDVHRWLVSYADYMTLLFALFVVLYAMAMVNEKPFETITESIGKVFQADKEKVKNKGHGDDILMVNSAKTEKKLYGNGILDVAGPDLVDGEKDLSNIKDSQVGTNLTALEQELNTALYDIIESGYAQLQIDGDWLEIELNSGLLFPSGSASVTNNAKSVIDKIYSAIAKSRNYIRVRGYTDNQAIKTEVFSSNWELSVYRATAILRLLESLGVTPKRMAIEGYGQYRPIADNTTKRGRSRNRRVVIAISKYAISEGSIKEALIVDKGLKSKPAGNNVIEATSDKVTITELENGGIRISSRKESKIK